MPNPRPVRRHAAAEALAEDLNKRIVEIIKPCTNAQIGRLIGVSDETIRRIRHGDIPSIRVIVGLCHALEISADWMLMGRGDPPSIDHRVLVEPKTRTVKSREIAGTTPSRQ